MKAKERIKSAEELEQEREWARRRNLSDEVRHMVGKRDHTVQLKHHYHGDLGSRTEITSRGKVVNVLYVLPPLAPELRGRSPEHERTR